jgi:ATP-dependent RNA helicase DOB1
MYSYSLSHFPLHTHTHIHTHIHTHRGSELLQEVTWIVFDEVHYMRDKERGVVWEETLVLLPRAMRVVCLSATVANAEEFTEWICRLKQAPCNMVATDVRPVPLYHFLQFHGHSTMKMIKSPDKAFSVDAVLAMQNAVPTEQAPDTQSQKQTRHVSINRQLGSLIALFRKNKWMPCITFCFGRRECESYALSVPNDLQLNSQEDRERIALIVDSAGACVFIYICACE